MVKAIQGSCIWGKINSISRSDWDSVVQNVFERKWSEYLDDPKASGMATVWGRQWLRNTEVIL